MGNNSFDWADVPEFVMNLVLVALVVATIGGIVWAGIDVLFFND